MQTRLDEQANKSNTFVRICQICLPMLATMVYSVQKLGGLKLTIDELLDHFAVDGQRHGAITRAARHIGCTRQYLSYVVNKGEIPMSLQYELEVRTKGALKADQEVATPIDLR